MKIQSENMESARSLIRNTHIASVSSICGHNVPRCKCRNDEHEVEVTSVGEERKDLIEHLLFKMAVLLQLRLQLRKFYGDACGSFLR